MIIAHKIAMDPNDLQETYFCKAAGTARFSYNWALNQWQQQYDAWKRVPTLPKPSDAALRRQLNAHQGGDVSVDAGGHQKRAADGDYSLGASIQKFLRRRRGVPHP